MAPPAAEEPRPVEPVFFDQYTIVCLVALAAMFAIEFQQGPALYTPLLLVVGLVGVLARLPLAPILVLVVLAAGHLLEQHRLIGLGGGWYVRSRALRVADVGLCAAVLAYVAAHYRLQSLTRHVFPLDPRRREPTKVRRPPVARVRRSAVLVTPDEVAWLLLALPVPALLAQLVWMILDRPWDILGLPWQLGRVLLVLWALAVGGFVVTGLVGHWRTRRMTAAEGALFLQDVVWRETRREQRQVNQWVAWWQARREEGP
ncbi:MAG: hypothetical protein IT429_02685 [Gemmataceae bacterium]|nr:hypothetical protein [Gemmataceae bacterium]